MPMTMPGPRLPPAAMPPTSDDSRNGSASTNGSHPRPVFEAPTSPVFAAVSRHKILVAFFTLLFAAAGVAFGYSRPVAYEASATLQVGQVNPNSPGFYGYAQSASSLATSFSRAITAKEVLDQVDEKLAISPGRAAARLAAEPIPQSPAFRVIATGASGPAAEKLANVAASAVIAYEAKSNSGNAQAQSLLAEVRSSSLNLSRAEKKVGELKESGASLSRVLESEATVSALRVKSDATGNAYKVTLESQAPRQGLVSLVSGATPATGNRSSHMQLFGLAGFLIGLVVGCLAAWLLYRREIKTAAIGSTATA